MMRLGLLFGSYYALLWTMPMHIGILPPMMCHKTLPYMQSYSKFYLAVNVVLGVSAACRVRFFGK